MPVFDVGGPILATSDVNFQNLTSDSYSTPQKIPLNRISLKFKQFLKMSVCAVGGPIYATSDENFEKQTPDSSSRAQKTPIQKFSSELEKHFLLSLSSLNLF
jgi:hypothetical protein